MKKFDFNIKWVLAAAAGAGLLAGIYIFSGRFFAWHRDRKPEFPAAAEVNSGTVHQLGDEVKFSFDAAIPEHRKILSARLQLPEHTVPASEVKFHRRNWRWHHGKWHFSGTLRGIKAGKSDSGSVVVELSPGRNRTGSEFFTIPMPLFSFTLDPAMEGNQELLLADAVDELPAVNGSSSWRTWGTAGVIIVIFAVAAFFWWRHKPEKKLLTPWERAENALEKLQIDMVNRDIPPAAAIMVLSDIIRRYLQERYLIPVLPATTAEFLLACRDSEVIPESEKTFLAELLQTADMVKFAKGSAVADSVALTINRAAKLVAVTKTLPTDSKGA